ncbi:hypothetical protein B0O99DRAFT_589761 [Bisporella sp. PMI_857]|nr:hypothetical protein B0O99DRAFT_589761 [Bisporella sp. PMI_857]
MDGQSALLSVIDMSNDICRANWHPIAKIRASLHPRSICRAESLKGTPDAQRSSGFMYRTVGVFCFTGQYSQPGELAQNPKGEMEWGWRWSGSPAERARPPLRASSKKIPNNGGGGGGGASGSGGQGRFEGGFYTVLYFIIRPGARIYEYFRMMNAAQPPVMLDPEKIWHT